MISLHEKPIPTVVNRRLDQSPLPCGITSLRAALFFFVLTLMAPIVSNRAAAGGLPLAYMVSVSQQACCIRPQDQVWLISTRRLGRNANPCSCSVPKLAYFQYCGTTRQWTERCPRDFMATNDPAAINTVYVHGNRQRAVNVENRGLQAYCLFKQCADCRTIRHVIWEWPSMPIPIGARVYRDGRVKLRRTPAQSYFLGWWLQQLPPGLDVRMLGYSYGSRTILGALQLLDGGELNGRRLPARPWCCTVKPRVALWAAATQANWLCRNGCHGRALQATRGCLNVFNQDDPVLSRLNRITLAFNDDPLGLTGINLRWPLTNMNATSDVGRRHGIDFYFQSTRVRNCTRQFLGLQ